ncbi:MAG: hypothetical protein SXQ77_08250, partial [Halobacteria archaeon]|nr:hypothetical protein [Halobacteria archaeon]
MDRTVLILVLALLALFVGTSTVGTVTVSAHPPDSPEHGVNESEFKKWWSRDTGSNPSPTSSVTEMISGGSDYSFMTPPDVSDWNTGELREFDTGDKNELVYPSEATIETGNSAYIESAYVEIFAVSPSTLVHETPRGEPMRYVPSEGKVMGVIDYKLDVPSGICPSGDCLVDHRIAETQV